jgi:hypothetical protein
MSECDALRPRLQELLDGSAPEIRLHLEICDPCRTLIEELRRVDRTLSVAGSTGSVSPPGLADRVLGRLESEQQRGVLRETLRLCAAAAVLLAAGTALFILLDSEPALDRARFHAAGSARFVTEDLPQTLERPLNRLFGR